MYSFFTTLAEVKREIYVWNKSTISLIWKEYEWYFKVASIRDLIDREKFWKEYHYTTEYEADIQEWDLLLINWENYNVKRVSKKKALNEIEFLFCLLIKEW